MQACIDPLKDAVYGAGEPTGEAHGRMKAAMAAVGILRRHGASADACADSRRERGDQRGDQPPGLTAMAAA